MIGFAWATGCTNLPTPIAVTRTPVIPEYLVPQVISIKPHDTNSFTEGLVWNNGVLYESSGLYGQSDLRQVEPQSGRVLRRVPDPPEVFGEGLALNRNQLVQLTWHENIAYIYDLNSFSQVGSYSYDGEGWGLCFDGNKFYMTDGSATIVGRDPVTFSVTNQVEVVRDGQPVTNLNELECVGDSLYANVWQTNNILRIEKGTGRITAVIDASGLLTQQESAAAGSDGVLNGIAYDPSHDTFLITGKLWPKMFEVRFAPK
jgi:glutaminyl-peptide cyclotransferase